MLNFEADAFEAFDFILTCMHTWSQVSSQPHKIKPLAESHGDYNLARAARISCDRQSTSPCFIHNMFF